jgi:hypothetical protein
VNTPRDWREPLPLHTCRSCRSPETSCESLRVFRGDRCCADCDHDHDINTEETKEGDER